MSNDLPNFDSGPHVGNQRDRSYSTIDLIDNVYYFRWHFFIIFLFISSGALLYAIFSTPIFTADALIQVEEKRGTSLGALTQVANALGAQQSPILGEIEILRSRSVVGRAVDNLKANVEIEVQNRIPIIGNWLARTLSKNSQGLVVPPWTDSSIAWGGEQLKFSELDLDPTYIGVPLMLSIGDDLKWELSDRAGVVVVKGDGIERLGQSADGKTRIIISSILARPGTKFRITTYSIQSRISQILDKLVANETKRQSGIIKVAYDNPNAAFSAAMLNEIAYVYVQQNVNRRSEEAELSLEFLNTELPKLRVQLDASERALNDFRSKAKTMDISSEIKELLVKSTNIEKSNLELELRKREYEERYDPSHPLMKALNSQLRGIRQESAELAAQVGRLPLVEQQYIRLARDVQVNNQLYVSLLNNAQQLQIAKAGTTGNVAIVDKAVVPERASKPKKPLIVAIGVLLGLLLGFLVSQWLAFISKVVRDPKRVELETGLSVLAVVPLDLDQGKINETHGASGTFLIAQEKPNSSSVEALRSLRTSLLFLLPSSTKNNIILITSAVPSQGKSFISANLAYLLAIAGKRTLLIDADIRLATLHKYMKLQVEGDGLSTILQDGITSAAIKISKVQNNLDMIPAGPTVRNPGDLLSTDQIQTLIGTLATHYDYVIVDSPPLLPVNDARSLAKIAGATFYVVRQDSVSITEVLEGLDLISKVGAQVSGVVFNGFMPTGLRYGYGYRYGYRYRKRSGYYNRSYSEYGGYRNVN